MPLVAACAAAAAVAVVALVYFPLELLIACLAVLVAAILWRSRSRRSGGAGLMPVGVVWGAAGTLILSVGAVAVRTMSPGADVPSAASVPLGSFEPGPEATDSSTPPGSPGSTPAPSIAMQSPEPAQHVNQAAVPGTSGRAPVGVPQSASSAATQPSSTSQVPAAPPAASQMSTAAPRPSGTATDSDTAAPSKALPAPSASGTPSLSNCVAPLSGLVSVKICG
ncbi:hypothetical protein SPF06_05775 [Sinomonas sp. JGH33]|uniref:Uncharacterized protein n=1 Tax=Sinomonas terricola TaxID=3110330 RepID=A0ABU5T3Y9_9MICC|nr:hypothetical protein [Sinomonas sp. JGH33]MEA5454229.1 hypothetical protein [Sinomonas sp. JGH33]